MELTPVKAIRQIHFSSHILDHIRKHDTALHRPSMEKVIDFQNKRELEQISSEPTCISEKRVSLAPYQHTRTPNKTTFKRFYNVNLTLVYAKYHIHRH